MSQVQVNPVLKQVYRDITVCLGGIFAVHKGLIQDELIWEIGHTLEQLYYKHNSRFAGNARKKTKEPLAPHPAIVNLLERIKELA